jgi:zinc-ribbon domain
MQLLAALFGLFITVVVLLAIARIFRISDDVAAIRRLLASAVPSAPQAAPGPVAPLTPGRTCPKCGQSLSEDATVCDKCGVILAKARSDQPRKV